MGKSDNEAWFDNRWAIIGGPPPEDTDHVFHPTRKWELDRAWPSVKVAVEIDGGGHKMFWDKYHKDIAKQNAAMYHGWTLFRCTARMCNNDDVGFLDMLKNFLEAKYTELENSGD